MCFEQKVSIPLKGMDKDSLYVAALESGVVTSELLETRLQEMLDSVVEDFLDADTLNAFVERLGENFPELIIERN